MTFSFIIVALNAEDAIGRSLDCLVNQDFPHDQIEVILVDGLSIDNTKKIMEDFRDRYSKSFNSIVVLDNPGKYLACGWNVALSLASGDIIIRVDAHTVFPNDFLRKNYMTITDGESICGGRVVSILEKDTGLNRLLLEAENSMFGGGFSFFRRGDHCKYVNTLAFASYRKEVFAKTGPYNEKLIRTEDNDMHYRMRQMGYRFFFNPDIISYRYCRSSLRGLLRQKFLNGYWVGLTLYVQPKAFSIFYLAPALFVLSVIATTVLAFWVQWPSLLLLLSYGTVLLASLIASCIRKKCCKEFLMLPLVLLALHFVYGIGTLYGIANIPSWKKEYES